MESLNKTVNILGGGITALSTGIYSLKEGFNSVIYTKSNNLGNSFIECFSLGILNDYFVVGKEDEFSELWKELGIENINTEETEYIYRFDNEDSKVYFFKNVNSFEKHLYEISIFDKSNIDFLIKAIKEAMKIKFNFNKPYELMGVMEYAKRTLESSKYKKFFSKYSDIDILSYANKFQSNVLKNAFLNFVNPRNSFAILALILALYADDKLKKIIDCSFVKKMEELYLSLGGKIEYKFDIKNIEYNKEGINIVYNEDKTLFKNNDEYVINTIDPYEFYQNILKKRGNDARSKVIYEDVDNSKISSKFFVSYELSKKSKENKELIKNFNSFVSFDLDKKFRVGSKDCKYFKLIYKNGKLNIMIDQTNDDYDFWLVISKNKNAYNNEKNRIIKDVFDALINKYSYLKGAIDDVLSFTPLDFNQVFGYYKGGINGFITSPKKIGLYLNEKVSNFNNLYLVSTWSTRPNYVINGIVNSKFLIKKIANDIRKENEK